MSNPNRFNMLNSSPVVFFTAVVGSVSLGLKIACDVLKLEVLAANSPFLRSMALYLDLNWWMISLLFLPVSLFVLKHTLQKTAELKKQSLTDSPPLQPEIDTPHAQIEAKTKLKQTNKSPLKPDYLHKDQVKAQQAFPNYSTALLWHIAILGYTIEEFAIKANLTLEVAKYLLEHPQYIPRPDWISDIARALMIREKYFAGEKEPYTNELAFQRYKWYEMKGIAEAFGYNAAITKQGNEAKVIVSRIESLRANKIIPGPSALKEAE